MSTDRRFESGRRSKRAVHDLRREGSIGAFDRTAAKLRIEGGRRPGLIMRDPLKHASRDQSGWSYHAESLLSSPWQARRLEATLST